MLAGLSSREVEFYIFRGSFRVQEPGAAAHIPNPPRRFATPEPKRQYGDRQNPSLSIVKPDNPSDHQLKSKFHVGHHFTPFGHAL